MSTIIIAFILVIIASVFQGSFGIGMKYNKPLSWEAWWLIHASLAMLIIPMIWALISVPNLFLAINESPSNVIFIAMLFGFLWGIGGILFGISINYVGVSMTYGIVMGLASAIGSLIPLIQIEGATSSSGFIPILIGVILLLVGVLITAIAGILRDKLQDERTGKAAGIKKGKSFKIGIALAVSSGVLSALLNVGFSNATQIAMKAEEFGAITRNSSLASWIVVLWGAAIMNLGYAIVKLIINKSFISFSFQGSRKAYLWAIVSAICWFGALGLYGQGATLMGVIGPVIGWPMLLGLSLIVSNFWAYRAKEWKNAVKPFLLMKVGLVVLIIACCILGYSNQFF